MKRGKTFAYNLQAANITNNHDKPQGKCLLKLD